jgi:hypothetical protein
VGKRKKRHDPASAAVASSGRGRGVAVVVLVGAAVALAWATWRPTSEPTHTPAPALVNTGTPAPLAPPASPASSSGAYAALVGEWVRPDGGYVLAVSAVAPDGKATASYFNPRPIHVARAEAKLEGGLVGLLVELRDANYPGSTYTLGHDTATDQLKGIYYQAAQGAQYEVVFSRRR